MRPVADAGLLLVHEAFRHKNRSEEHRTANAGADAKQDGDRAEVEQGRRDRRQGQDVTQQDEDASPAVRPECVRH